MPGYEAMAKDLGRLEAHQRGYPVMSWSAHAGLSSAGRHVRVEDDLIRIVPRPSPEPSFVYVSALCRAAASLPRAITLAAETLGRTSDLTAEFEEARATAAMLCTGFEDSYELDADEPTSGSKD
jgi:hypothetical protein